MKKIKELFLYKKYVFLLLLFSLLYNGLMYYGGKYLAIHKFHYDMTLPIDRLTPFVPWTIIFYWGCYLFWGWCFLWIALQKKEDTTRFYFTYFLGELICFLFFVFLPTTNVRPVITETDFWNRMVVLLYETDDPYNLFPSIHCMVSWICWIGVRGKKNCPVGCRWFSLFMAVAVCVTTLTLKQHVIVDVIGAILIAEVIYLLSKDVWNRMMILTKK